PRRSVAPGTKFSISTSARAARSRTSLAPSGRWRSTAIPRLLRFTAANTALMPPRPARPRQSRRSSPRPGRSTLMTSAPRSARSMAQYGPATTREQSSTRMPARSAGVSGARAPGAASLTAGDPGGPPAPAAARTRRAPPGRHPRPRDRGSGRTRRRPPRAPGGRRRARRPRGAPAPRRPSRGGPRAAAGRGAAAPSSEPPAARPAASPAARRAPRRASRAAGRPADPHDPQPDAGGEHPREVGDAVPEARHPRLRAGRSVPVEEPLGHRVDVGDPGAGDRVDARLDLGHRPERLGRQPGRVLAHRLRERGRRDDAVHEPDRLGVGGAVPPPLHDDLLGAGGPHQADEPRRGGDAQRHA